MSLADIKAKISAEAQGQIKGIERENEEQIALVTQGSDDAVKTLQRTYKDRLGKEEAEIQKRREIVALLDAHKVELGVKQRLIGESFESAVRQLAELPRERYLAFAQSLMEKATQSREEVVFVGKGERHIDHAWLDSYNAAHGTRLSLSGDRLPIAGGFVLREGKIDINCSWDVLVNAVRSEIESDVVKQLFP